MFVFSVTKQSFCKRLTKLIKSPNYRYSHSPTYGNPTLFQMCRRYPGFKRVALQDPQPERRFFRRGWVTFSKECNIKEVCWSLNNIRVSPVLSTLYLSFVTRGKCRFSHFCGRISSFTILFCYELAICKTLVFTAIFSIRQPIFAKACLKTDGSILNHCQSF